MSAADDNGPDFGGDEALAAEYVLGVLPSDERQTVAERIERDPAFARLVERWEADLSPMAAAYQAVEPPASVKAALERRLFAASPRTAAKAGLWANLAFWRSLAAAAIAALVLYTALPLFNAPVAPPPQARLVASLAADGSEVKYLAIYDAARGEVGLSHVSGERGTGKDFELWMIEGGNAPVSMGIIPAGASTRLAIEPAAREKLAQGAVLAVSLEPAGGSPTGQPTGPVVAAGDLRSI